MPITGSRLAAVDGKSVRAQRMKNPALVLPDAMKAILALKSATEKSGIPPKTLELAQFRGCSAGTDARHAVPKSGRDE